MNPLKILARWRRARQWRPGPRAAVLTVCAVLVAGTAFAVSANVSDHLARTAVNEAVRTTEAVVRGYVDPMVTGGGFSQIAPERRDQVNAELSRLVASGNILRIKIWAPDGTVVYSDLPALRSRQFAVRTELAESLEGNVATEFSDATAEENVYERGLAARFLEIYLPIRATGSNEVLGAYEIYQDAASIEGDIASTRQDVLLIVGAMALLLLGLLFAAFSGTSRLLAQQNRRLRASDDRFRLRLGVRLAIDDFGTGYSSLSYLRRFPIDELKIDRSFVSTVNVGPDQSALVRSIVKLGDTLHLGTVAEGIEEAEQLRELTGLGADLGQGFYFAKPLTPDAISALIAAGDGSIDSAAVRRNAA